MAAIRDWQRTRDMWVKVLEKQTGEGVAAWNRRIRTLRPRSESALRDWLARQGVTGYAQSLLVMERFGYPDFILATADQLIERQYSDRKQLRPILSAITRAADALGEVTIQARKGYVSLVSTRRTFARVRPTTKSRVDLGLRLQGVKVGGRLERSTIHETMPVQIGLTAADQVDAEVMTLLRRAYAENS